MEEGPGVGSRAIIRPQAPAAFTRPIMKSAQWSAMPRPAAASAAERASEATTTSCLRARCRIMLNGRICRRARAGRESDGRRREFSTDRRDLLGKLRGKVGRRPPVEIELRQNIKVQKGKEMVSGV